MSSKYKDALKETTNEIRKSKLNFERKLAANIKQNSKSLFADIRSKQKVKDMPDTKDNDGIVIAKGKEMADALIYIQVQCLHWSTRLTFLSTSLY